MKKVGDLISYANIDNMKQESVYMLSKEKHIQDFLRKNGLKPSIIFDYWVEFLDFNDDYYQCLNCKGLNNCLKDNIGLKKTLVYSEGQVHLDLSACEFGKSIERRREIEKQYIVKNVNDDLIFTDITSLDMVKNIASQSVNNKNAFMNVVACAKTESFKGLYLYGSIESDKTRLFAGMAYELAKKDKTIAFVHFPTYLIELKNSFSSGENTFALDKLMNAQYLILDSIGEENVTAWSRDEILLTVLSYRLLNNLPTFFTSIYTFKELLDIYTLKAKDNSDKIRAKTLVSKIKALTTEIKID